MANIVEAETILSIEGDDVIIRLKGVGSATGSLSGTGKTMGVASTHGFQALSVKGRVIKISMNAFVGK